MCSLCRSREGFYYESTKSSFFAEMFERNDVAAVERRHHFWIDGTAVLFEDVPGLRTRVRTFVQCSRATRSLKHGPDAVERAMAVVVRCVSRAMQAVRARALSYYSRRTTLRGRSASQRAGGIFCKRIDHSYSTNYSN